MKKLRITALLALLVIMASCGGLGKAEANAEGFTTIENEIKSKFGDDAYYTQINVSYDENIGNLLSVTVAEDPNSLEMEEWTCIQNVWNQTSDITIELPEGTKATDFMFQLKDKINLKKLGELVETSMKNLTAEKDIQNPRLDNAYIAYPDNGDASKAEYSIMLEPENGGTTFSYYYSLSGEFLRMNY